MTSMRESYVLEGVERDNMNILVTSANNYTINGITNVIMNLYRGIRCESLNVDFVAIKKPDYLIEKEAIDNGSTFFIVPRKFWNPFSYVRLLSKIAVNYDVVHANGNSSTLILEMIATRIARVPVVIAHGHSATGNHKILHYLIRPIFVKLCTHRIACSKFAGNWLFGKKPFTVIKNAFNVTDFQFDQILRDKFRREYKLEGKTIIGHIGSFSDLKNHKFLISVFAEYKKKNNNAVLFLIGKGTLLESIKMLVDSLNLTDSVIFAGQRSDVNVLINIFDCFVFPSLSEGFGIVLVEAQANGLPVFASKDVISNEVKICDNFHFLSLDKSAKEWADVISETNLERSINAHEKVISAGYQIEEQAAKLLEIYSNAIQTTADKEQK